MAHEDDLKPRVEELERQGENLHIQLDLMVVALTGRGEKNFALYVLGRGFSPAEVQAIKRFLNWRGENTRQPWAAVVAEFSRGLPHRTESDLREILAAFRADGLSGPVTAVPK